MYDTSSWEGCPRHRLKNLLFIVTCCCGIVTASATTPATLFRSIQARRYVPTAVVNTINKAVAVCRSMRMHVSVR